MRRKLGSQGFSTNLLHFSDTLAPTMITFAILCFLLRTCPLLFRPQVVLLSFHALVMVEGLLPLSLALSAFDSLFIC